MLLFLFFSNDVGFGFVGFFGWFVGVFFPVGGLRVEARTNNRKSLLKKTEICALLCILIGIPLFC